MLTNNAKHALGVVFMVDSTAFKANPSDTAEYLYELLTSPELQRLPFLILCNKQDMVWLCVKPALIKSKLEAEFNTIRESRRSLTVSLFFFAA
jgi:signal recognition particle receptor subunit beta